MSTPYCENKGCALFGRIQSSDSYGNHTGHCGYCERKEREKKRKQDPDLFCTTARMDCYLRLKAADSEICGFCVREEEAEAELLKS